MYNKINEPHYYMLVASFPSFKRELADHKELPITNLHLQDRLKYLAPQDGQAIDAIVDLVTTDSFDSDDAYLNKYTDQTKYLKGTKLDPILTFFMDWRVIVSALRASIKGEDCPDWLKEDQHPLMETIATNWHKPNFDLKSTYPAIGLLRESMKADNTIVVENMLLKLFWNYLSETAFDALFGLDAVATYTLRWYVLKRWLRRDYDQALTTVNETIENILEKTEFSL